MASVFISYRREDAAAYAGRICDRLGSELSTERVFMDVQDIGPGEDFINAIDNRVASCDLLVAVIGPDWLRTLRERSGHDDFVRQEILSALRRKIPIIPLLVNGAVMPGRLDLPPELTALSRMNALEIRDSRFDDDIDELTGAVRRLTSSVTASRPRWIKAALAITGLALAISLWWFSWQTINIDGVWIAEMEKPGQKPYSILLNFASNEDRVVGTVEYPTGSAAVQEGKIRGTHISFFTSHVPDFSNEPAVIHWEGELNGDAIRLQVADPGGLASGIARRGPAIANPGN
jgi:hypothetical protein